MHGRHRSLDKDLKQSVKWLETIPYIVKIVLGFSECCRHKYSPGHLKVKSETLAGLKLNGYSGKGVTDIFIKIEPIEKLAEVKAIIENKFL